jgi:predicted branched-subunit amino acid permease
VPTWGDGRVMVSGRAYAGTFQVIFVAMILAASGITRMLTTLLLHRRALSAARQFALRPERGAAGR